MCFTWREGSFPAAGREMLLSAELLAVTEGLALLFYLWGLALGHAVALPLLALTLVVLFGLSEIEPKPLLYSLCWSWGCGVPQELLQGSSSSGPAVPTHGHSGEWSPSSPDLGTAWSVLSLTAAPAPALHREVEAVENPHSSWMQSLVPPVLAGKIWWKKF